MREGTERTKIHDVADEVRFELERIELEGAEVPCVAALVDVDGNLGGPVDVADVSS